MLIDDCPADFFNESKGLKQGDPLSHFLFFMVSEALSRMIKKAEMGFISGFSMGVDQVMVSHLQFADDTMIFGDVDAKQVGYFRCILGCFEAVSGLKINLSKNKMFQVDEECDNESLAWILGFKLVPLHPHI